MGMSGKADTISCQTSSAQRARHKGHHIEELAFQLPTLTLNEESLHVVVHRFTNWRLQITRC